MRFCQQTCVFLSWFSHIVAVNAGLGPRLCGLEGHLYFALEPYSIWGAFMKQGPHKFPSTLDAAVFLKLEEK